MQNVKLTVAIDPIHFGSFDSTEALEGFTFNLSKNIEKTFNVKVDYDTIPNGNTYHLSCDDRNLEMYIAEFVESNWK